MSEVNMAVAHDLLKEDAVVPAAWESSVTQIDLRAIRIATQARELVLQGTTLKNTLKEMNEVWLSLFTEDKRCLITDMQATKVRAQLITLYGVKLIKYINSIVGLDLVPLAQDASPENLNYGERDPADRNWKIDSVMLNIGSNKITSHEHLFKLMMINIFGVSELVVDFALEPTYGKLRSYLTKTYDWHPVDEPCAPDEAVPTLEALDATVIVAVTQGKLTIG